MADLSLDEVNLLVDVANRVRCRGHTGEGATQAAADAERRLHDLFRTGETLAVYGDRFEGAGYRRILAPVFSPGPAGKRRPYTVANLYAAAEAVPATPPSGVDDTAPPPASSG